MTVGERIAQKRKENNLSMEALGEMLGVGKSAINKWEKGYVQRISRPMIIKMAKIFDCDPAWLGGYISEEEERAKGIVDSYINDTLSSDDRELLDLYHIASPEMKAMVDFALKRNQQKP